MPQRSGGFADQAKLRDHFDRHGRALGASTPADYERQANNFLNGPPSPGVLEKTRANGDIVRFDLRTDKFGVVRADGTIRTYYKLDPARHQRPSNLDYFNEQ